MANLSITTAWNETASFVQREARLLFPIAFLLIALPGGLLQMLMPATVPGQPPEFGAWLLVVPVGIIAGMIGSISISFLALRPGASVGEALEIGARRFIMLLAASLLIGIAATVLVVPLILVIGGGAAMNGTQPDVALIGFIGLFTIVVLAAALSFWVRLMLMTAVTAAENPGPIGIISRSWELTSGHFWKLLGFVLLAFVVFIVVSMVVGAIGGIAIVLIAGQLAPGSFATFLVTLVGALVNMVMTVYFTTLLARIYVQLSGSGREGVFA